MDHVYAQLVHDALGVLDRYRAPLAMRDHVKSLDGCEELLRRVRASLEPLTFKGIERRDDVTEILRRIDEAHSGRLDAPLTFPAREDEPFSQSQRRQSSNSAGGVPSASA